MLYQLHEMQRSFLRPLAEFTDLGARWIVHPTNPFAYTPIARQVAAGLQLAHRVGKDYHKPAWDILSIDVNGRQVSITEQVVLAKPFCNLLHFQRDTARSDNPRVLLVAPVSGHHATLLRDTARTLLPEHDVYVTDWIDARMVPMSAGPFHLDDYVHYIQEFIRYLGQDSDIHVISVCQPTVPVLAAISLMASADEPVRPKSMVMMGGPIDPRQSPTQVNSLATEKPYSWFEHNLIQTVPGNYRGFGRRVYPGFLQHAGFMTMNPDRHLKSHYDFYLDLLRGDDDDAETHRRFYDEYNAVMDMPAEFYLDTIKTVFQEFALPNGSWRVSGELVQPGDIKRTALLAIEGELDDIAGVGQTRAAIDLCKGIPASRKKYYLAEGAGHYGIFSGRRWREQVYPKIAAFIRNA